MNTVWKGFASYAAIGAAATLIHWQIFLVLTVAVELKQGLGNLLAFCVAGLFSKSLSAGSG